MSVCLFICLFAYIFSALRLGRYKSRTKKDFGVRFFLNSSRLLVVCVAWCMAAGEQCASTSEQWSLRGVMSQCVWFGQFCDVCGRASLGCVGELVSGMMAVQ